ncbi:MAG: class I SAM-dependent methyltransferase [Clostridia bacterium]
MIKLDKRLKAIAGLIAPCETLCDVASDHCKLAIYISQNNLAKTIIASDISYKCLKKMQAKCAEQNVKLDLRVADGLQGFAETHLDVVVIAGLGGREIIHILQNNKVAVDKFILVPHQHSIELREYLSGKFDVNYDHLLQCGKKFYDILVAEKGCKILTQKQIYFGQNTLDNADFVAYLKQQKGKLNYVLQKTNDEKIKNNILLELQIMREL